MNLKEQESILQEKLRPLIEKEGFKLFELRLLGAQGKLLLRVLVDWEEGGISLKDCSWLNRKLAEHLEKENIIAGDFCLEVFSPGIDRDLREPQDFLRVKNKNISFWLKQELQGKLYWEAKLIGLNSDKNELSVETAQGSFIIPISNIKKAKQKV